MQNMLKPITNSIIEMLHQAHIRTIMLTGDNILTAISVSRQCKLVNPELRVFLGELEENKVNKIKKLIWKDVEFSSSRLDPTTLELEEVSQLEELSEINEESFYNEEESIDEDLERIIVERKMTSRNSFDLLKAETKLQIPKTPTGSRSRWSEILPDEKIHEMQQLTRTNKKRHSLFNSPNAIPTNISIEQSALDQGLSEQLIDMEPPWYNLHEEFIIAMTGYSLYLTTVYININVRCIIPILNTTKRESQKK